MNAKAGAGTNQLYLWKRVARVAGPTPDSNGAPVYDLSKLESHLWEAANILRGPVDADLVPPQASVSKLLQSPQWNYTRNCIPVGGIRGSCYDRRKVPLTQREIGVMNRKRKPERASPRLRAAFLQIVRNQLDANDPPETRKTVERLMAQGISAQDSERYIAQAVAAEVWYILHENEPFNLERYVRNLARLPASSWDEQEEGESTSQD